MQTITDGLEEEPLSQPPQPQQPPEKHSVRLLDRPELISPNFPSDYINSRYILQIEETFEMRVALIFDLAGRPRETSRGW